MCREIFVCFILLIWNGSGCLSQFHVFEKRCQMISRNCIFSDGIFWVVCEIDTKEFEILYIGSQCVYMRVHAFKLVVKSYNA